MDGVISQLFHQPGEYITPGDPAVVRLLVMDKLFAVFNIPVEDTAVVQVGSPVRVFLRSISTTINASISSIAPDIDGESGTVQVRVELDNANRSLLAGDRCTLQLASHAIPSSARLPATTTRTRGTTKR
jgi:multidrug efflux pump subunit AcrA (membrane-fusion protein)